jgi:hypothetical protein
MKQDTCTHGLTLYRPHVCIISKTKINTGSPDQEEAFGIDNQGLLKAWMLLLTEKKNNARNRKTQKDKLRQDCEPARLRQDLENPLRMYNYDREEEDCLSCSLNSYTLIKPLQLALTCGM